MTNKLQYNTKSHLVNKQNEILYNASLSSLEEIKANITALLEVMGKQKGSRYAMAVHELTSALDSLQEAINSVKDVNYTKKIFGLDMAEYAESIAFTRE